MVSGATYRFSFSTQANPGNPTPRSPASLQLSIGGVQYWAGYTVSGTYSGNPGGTNTNLLTISPAYTVQNWTFNYVAATTGSVCLVYRWTAYRRGVNSAQSTDDIGSSAPTVTCV